MGCNQSSWISLPICFTDHFKQQIQLLCPPLSLHSRDHRKRNVMIIPDPQLWEESTAPLTPVNSTTGSQLGICSVLPWSSCKIDFDALSAVKPDGVEADTNEPGVPSSQPSLVGESWGTCHLLCSCCQGSSRGQPARARAEWSMGPSRAPSLCVHAIPATSSVAKSIFTLFP